jgi:hypothetical protein
MTPYAIATIILGVVLWLGLKSRIGRPIE